MKSKSNPCPSARSQFGIWAAFRIATIILLTACIVVPIRGNCQSPQASGSTAPSFEVASIKPSDPTAPNSATGFRFNADGFSIRRVTLQRLIQFSYQLLEENQILGAPKWFASETYDIDAKMESSAADKLEKLDPDARLIAHQEMLQSLLAERFHLLVKLETREALVYSLVIAKNGPKLKEAKPADTYPGGIKAPAGFKSADLMFFDRDGITAQAVPMLKLVDFLESRFRRPVLDRTGLTGRYDFKLKYADSLAAGAGAADATPSFNPPDPIGPDLFTALEKQLGLKLVSGKGPVQFVVINHVERPSEN